MSELNKDWRPGFGIIYTWFAMDKNGKVAVMVNNCFGNLPRVLLELELVELLLDKLTEFVWEESPVYTSYPDNKEGGFGVDYYSSWRNSERLSKELIFEKLNSDLVGLGAYAEANLSANKGLFVYHAVEGSKPGQDYPVGYVGVTSMGDYYRYLVPGDYASIEDFPSELRKGIVVSKVLDFLSDRILYSDRVDEYFSSVYK